MRSLGFLDLAFRWHWISRTQNFDIFLMYPFCCCPSFQIACSASHPLEGLYKIRYRANLCDIRRVCDWPTASLLHSICRSDARELPYFRVPTNIANSPIRISSNYSRFTLSLLVLARVLEHNNFLRLLTRTNTTMSSHSLPATLHFDSKGGTYPPYGIITANDHGPYVIATTWIMMSHVSHGTDAACASGNEAKPRTRYHCHYHRRGRIPAGSSTAYFWLFNF